MSRFCGNLGFITTQKSTTKASVWDTIVVKKQYGGTVKKDRTTYVPGVGLITNARISVRISIIMNQYMQDNTKNLKFVEYEGDAWTVENFDTEYPRITFTLGGLYNGKTE